MRSNYPPLESLQEPSRLDTVGGNFQQGRILFCDNHLSTVDRELENGPVAAEAAVGLDEADVQKQPQLSPSQCQITFGTMNACSSQLK